MAVKTFAKNQVTGKIFISVYHAGSNNEANGSLDCFSQHFIDKYTKSVLYWKQQLIPRKKIGRPLVGTIDRNKRRKLLSLRRYHEKKEGHEEQVMIINEQIKNLEGGN
jgi:hypothetical protein